MGELKHLPVNEWPETDRTAFRAAYEPGDVFDGTSGPGAHLSEGTRKMIEISYRRWLGFLKANYPDNLSIPPAEHIKPERVRSFIERLRAEIKPITVVIAAHLGMAPRQIAARLNRQMVPSPRGGQWNASTINGNRRRRIGILNNELAEVIAITVRHVVRRAPAMLTAASGQPRSNSAC